MPSTRSATPPCPPGRGCASCSRPASAATAPTCSSAADSPSCTGRRDCGTFRSRPGPTPTRRTVLADLVRSLRPKIAELGLADERELTEVDQAVRTYLADPRTGRQDQSARSCHLSAGRPDFPRREKQREDTARAPVAPHYIPGHPGSDLPAWLMTVIDPGDTPELPAIDLPKTRAPPDAGQPQRPRQASDSA